MIRLGEITLSCPVLCPRREHGMDLGRLPAKPLAAAHRIYYHFICMPTIIIIYQPTMPHHHNTNQQSRHKTIMN